MKTAKKMISVTLIAAMVFSIAGCNEEEQPLTQSSVSFPWIDSDLFENIDRMAQADLKDDFAAAVDYEWASAQVNDYTYRIMSFGEAEKKVVEKKRALIEDDYFQNKNIELIRVADGLFCDWEYRDIIGVDPLKKYLDYIDQIQNIDDVSEYMIDNDRNPFAFSLVDVKYGNNELIDDHFALIITWPEWTLDNKVDYYVNMTEDGYKEKEKVENRVTYLLGRCGYSDKEIRDVLTRSFRFESELVHLDFADDYDFKKLYPMSEIIEKAGSYPLKEMLDHYSITDCDNVMGNISYVDHLEKIYKQSKVEDMKAYFKVRLALEAITYLDAGAYDCYKDSNLDRTNPFAERIDKDPDYSFFYLLHDTPLTAAMDQAYLDYYFDEATYNEVTDFVHQIKDKYKILINSNEHLTDEGKKAVLNKLDKMGENIMMPSNKADFTGVELIPKEEGGTFLDAMCVLSKVQYEHIGDMVRLECHKSFWDIYNGDLSTTKTGAAYHNFQNAIYIYAGILEDPIYSPDAPIEQKLGSFVAALGHEVSHAFDNTGVNRDADGNYNDLVSREEMAFWKDTEDRINDLYYNIEPIEGAGTYGSLSTMDITGEVIADIEGVRVSLMIAEDFENFDYDLFFRSYASFWRRLITKSDEMTIIKYDEHPCSYLRINFTLCQFEKFDETYGIGPGDGMYLDPELRVLIW